MKQHITKEQYYSLSKKGREALWEWMHSHKYYKDKSYYPTLAQRPSIGQMIEFLKGDKDNDSLILIETIDEWHEQVFVYDKDEELCDWLWEAVKEVLSK